MSTFWPVTLDVLGSCHSLFLANHRSSNQIALMEKENLKLTNKMSYLITGDIKKNKNHESHEKQDICNFSSLSVEEIQNKKFHKKGWILKISSLQLKLSISGSLSVFILSETTMGRHLEGFIVAVHI
jgi:hypothetical protein